MAMNIARIRPAVLREPAAWLFRPYQLSPWQSQCCQSPAAGTLHNVFSHGCTLIDPFSHVMALALMQYQGP